MYIVARSIQQGRLAGLVSVLGIGIGGCVHIVAAAAGVSAILASSAVAFSMVKLAGAGYLIYLGIRTLLRQPPDPTVEKIEPASLRETFWQGVLVNTLNPKSALFFFAFLPQFVDPARGSATLQTIALGLIFVSMAVVTDGAYALAAGSAGKWFRRRTGALRLQQSFAGTTYIALGVATAFADDPRSS